MSRRLEESSKKPGGVRGRGKVRARGRGEVRVRAKTRARIRVRAREHALHLVRVSGREW